MELEKRNKRVIIRDSQEQERDRLKKLKNEECDAAGSGSAAVAAVEGVVAPTEDEVEELFAILRRMKEAVKYFDEKGRGGKEWREALEQAEDAVDDGENLDDIGDDGGVGVAKNNEEELINEGLDLNAAAPEAAERGSG